MDITELSPEKLIDLKEIFQKYPGKNGIILYFKVGLKTYRQQVSEQISIAYNDKLIREIQEFLPSAEIWYQSENIEDLMMVPKVGVEPT